MDYFRRIKDFKEELKIIILQHKDMLKKAALPLLLLIALLIFLLSGESEAVTLTESGAADGSAAVESGEASSVSEDGTASSTASAGTAGSAIIYVDIGGEVNAPGVYELSEGTRLFQLIEKAGGLTDDADIDVINRAETVYDGQKILIASTEETMNSAEKAASNAATEIGGGIAADSNSAYSSGDSKVNINTAGSVDLQTIPGIGPSKAERIIEYRSSNGYFKSIEDIKNISGIGDKTFDNIKKYITI